VRDFLYRDTTVCLARRKEIVLGFREGKRKSYPTANRYVGPVNHTSDSVARAYIENQKEK
jgi:hypothetical protein